VKEKFLAMRAKQKIMLIVLLFAVITGAVGVPLKVHAAEATVTFGSNWYNKTSGDTFPVGVYLKAKAAIGDYHIEIKYDRLRLKYVEGADDADEENGVLFLDGNQNGRELKFWIQFKAISGGEALIEISSAEVKLRNSEEGEVFDITVYGSAPVHIKGEDTAAAVEERLAQEQQAEEASRAEEMEREEEEEQRAEEEQEGNDHGNRSETEESQQEESGVRGEDGDSRADGNADSHDKVKKEKRNYIFFNIYFVFAAAVILLIIVVDVAAWNIVKKARAKRKSRAQDEFEELENGGEPDKLELIDLDIEDQEADEGIPTVDAILARLEGVHKADGEILSQPDSMEPVLGQAGGKDTNEVFLTSEEELEWQFGRPIIRICDLTMEFKLYSVNPSGLKEYVVQLLKREVSYRRLYALYHVSFNVYKGEVIGIIGTNGSGKSTLLKIVSGALKPTEGHVEIVGHRKVQLLTLGTGFDMELTARENVFLNGSIIGYSREFLEAHYDEIVEFAELQDFMEEKVKNFSSGMVSRLGFAIATAGEAAEILILDEILSVGDEFFRQKSLKRIKEMIHGGSTVLMVSHSMGTILENCSRCVWIEKGELRMVGEPKVVCEEYRRMNG